MIDQDLYNIVESGFYPCYRDVEKHLSTMIFGMGYSSLPDDNFIWKGMITKQLESRPDISGLFTGIKLQEFGHEYAKFLITGIVKSTIGYMKDTMKDTTIISDFPERWNAEVKTIYMKYKFAQSAYDRIFYGGMLNDLFWNPLLDPNSPMVAYQNVQLMQTERSDKQVSRLMTESDVSIFAITESSDSLEDQFSQITDRLSRYQYVKDEHGIKTDVNNLFNLYYSSFGDDQMSTGEKLKFQSKLQETALKYINFIQLSESGYSPSEIYDRTQDQRNQYSEIHNKQELIRSLLV